MVLKLAQAGIGFTAWFNSETEEFFTIRVTDSLTNDQLKVLVDLGGMLQKDGQVMLIGKGFEAA
jgi:ethanolamine utilization protein EutQ (cupin superfamily)